MVEIILYPTETVYGLGVNAFDDEALRGLFELKGRDAAQSVSWLVRDIDDIKRYADVPPEAAKIAEQFLPGPLTLILNAKNETLRRFAAEDGTVSFRISSDPVAQKLIEEYMDANDAPLTATSANVHGMPTMPTPDEILAQFGENQAAITEVIDDGPRTGVPSTVVKVIDDDVTVIRGGAIEVGSFLQE